ncbi:hypothetical protein IU476_07980 [Nocardia blacklockiae]|nr:hypothetical protein [Nocardia blacklockiae]
MRDADGAEQRSPGNERQENAPEQRSPDNERQKNAPEQRSPGNERAENAPEQRSTGNERTENVPEQRDIEDPGGHRGGEAVAGLVVPVAAHPAGGSHVRPSAVDAGDGSAPPRGHSGDERSAPRGEADRGRCGLLALRALQERFPGRPFRLPEREVGAEGMSTRELVAGAGGKLRNFAGGHAEIASLLRSMKDGATALVVDTYRGPADRHGVGAHAYLMTREGNRIVVRDLAQGIEHGFPPRLTRELARSQAIVFDHNGRAVDRIGNRARDWMMRDGADTAAAARDRAHEVDLHSERTRAVLSQTQLGREILDALGDSEQSGRAREFLSSFARGREILESLGEPVPERFRPAGDDTGGRCGVGALSELIRMYSGASDPESARIVLDEDGELLRLPGEETVIRMPGRVIDERGMSEDELVAAAGGRLTTYTDHDDIANTLRRLGDRSAALVVDSYTVSDKKTGIGAHAYLMVNEGGRIVIRDAANPEGGAIRVPPELEGRPRAIVFDGRGRALESVDPATRRYLAERQFDPHAAGRIGRALDAAPDQVRELLRQTETGRRTLAALERMPVHERFDLMGEGGHRGGEWVAHEHAATVFTSGNDHVAQAVALVHESVHAQYYVEDRSVRDPLAMSRSEYVRAMVAEETACFRRQVELVVELRARGFEIRTQPTETAYDAAYRKAVERRGADSALTPQQIHEQAHESALRAAEQEVRSFRWADGRSYHQYYRDGWDRLAQQRAAQQAQAAQHLSQAPGQHPQPAPHPRAYRLTPAGVERMRTAVLHRGNDIVQANDLVRRSTQLASDHGVSFGATQQIRDQVTRKLAALDTEMATAPPERLPELRREQHRLRELADLADERDRFDTRIRWHAIKEMHDVLATDVVDRVLSEVPGAQRISDGAVLLPGTPKRLVIVGAPGEHHAVLGDPRVAAAARDAAVEYRVVKLQDNGELHVWTAPGLAEPPRPPVLTPLHLAETATRQRMDLVRARLGDTAVGEWALRVLDGVEIAHTADPGDAGYKPSLRRVVLDVGRSDHQHMADLVHHAIHVEVARSRDPIVALHELQTLSRDSYIDRMLDEETRAHAMEIIAALQLRAAGHDVPEPVGTHAYTEAYYRARAELLENIGLAGQSVPERLLPVLDRMSNEAGLDALRPEVRNHTEHGETYRDVYGRAWDVAQGVQPFAERVQAARMSGEKSAQALGVETTVPGVRGAELVTFDDGAQYVRKTLLNARMAQAEVLSSLLGRALGVPLPRAISVGTVVYHEVMSAALPIELAREGFGSTGLGLHDALTGFPNGTDRVVIEPGGKVAWGNHHHAFQAGTLTRETVTRFAERFLRVRADGGVDFVNHDLTRSEIAWVRDRLERLRPEFEALGQVRWHNLAMIRLAQIEAHARPDFVPAPDQPAARRPQHATGGENTTRRNISEPNRELANDDPPTGPIRRQRPQQAEPPVPERKPAPRELDEEAPTHGFRRATPPGDGSVPPDHTTLRRAENAVEDDPPTRPVRRTGEEQPTPRRAESGVEDDPPTRPVRRTGSAETATPVRGDGGADSPTRSVGGDGGQRPPAPPFVVAAGPRSFDGYTSASLVARAEVVGGPGERSGSRAWDAARGMSDGGGRFAGETSADDGSRAPGAGRLEGAQPGHEGAASGNLRNGDAVERGAGTDTGGDRGRCGELSLRELLRRYGEGSGIRLPERVIGFEGMSREELAAAAGGRLQAFSGHGAIADRLRQLGNGAAALVVDMYHSPADRYGVGGHAYLLVNEGGQIVVRDPSNDGAGPARLPFDVRSTEAILFDREGSPVGRLDDETRARLARQASADLSDPDRVGVGRALDTAPDQVRELLHQTETGRRALASLDRLPVRQRFERVADDGVTRGTFDSRGHDLAIFTAGHSHARQAVTVVHEALHAEYFADGRTADGWRMSREDYVRAMIDEETDCYLREAQLARELRALGYKLTPHAVERAYDRAHAEELSRLANSPMPREQKQAQAHQAGERAARTAVENFTWRDGRTYVDHYQDSWDRARGGGPDPHTGAEPMTPEVAQRLRRDAVRQLHDDRRATELMDELESRCDEQGIEFGDIPAVREQVDRKLTELDAALSDPATPADRLPELRREQLRLRELSDHADRWNNLDARLEASAKDLHDRAAADVVDRLARSSGGEKLSSTAVLMPGPRLTIVARPGEHAAELARLRDDPTVARLTDSQVSYRNIKVDGRGDVRLWEPTRTQSPPYVPAEVRPRDLVEAATRQRLDGIRAELSRTPVGEWAIEALDAHGVRIVHTADPTAQRYRPHRNELVLDAGLSDAGHMAALVHHAIHAEAAQGAQARSLHDRMTLDRDTYINRMIAEETRAHAMEIVALQQLRDQLTDLRAGREPLPDPVGARTYRDAFAEGYAEAKRNLGIAADEPVPTARAHLVEAMAHDAGVRALRPEVEAHTEHGETYRDVYGRAWDDAHGVRRFADIVGAARNSGVRAARDLDPGAARGLLRAELVAHRNGTVLIHKTFADAESAAAEVMSSELARELGTVQPRQVAVGNVVYTERPATPRSSEVVPFGEADGGRGMSPARQPQAGDGSMVRDPGESDPGGSPRIGRSWDPVPEQLRDLLSQTGIGRRILRTLDNGLLRERLEAAADAGLHGEFTAGDLTATVYTTGRDHLAQALALAHEIVHAEYFLEGRTVLVDDRIETMESGPFVDAMIDEEVACFVLEAELARELQALGYDARTSPADVEAAYSDRYERALDYLSEDPDLSPEDVREQARAEAVRAVRTIVELYPDLEGKTYLQFAAEIWDEAHPASGAEPSAAHRPQDPAVAERLRVEALHRHAESVRLQALSAETDELAARHGLDPAADHATLRREIEQRITELEAESSDPATSAERAAEIRRTQHELRELADRRADLDNRKAAFGARDEAVDAIAVRDVLESMLRDEPNARPVGDHAVRLPGPPERLVVPAAPGDHHALLRHPEIVGEAERLGRDAVALVRVEVDGIGRIHLETVAEAADPAATPPHETLHTDMAATASAQRLRGVHEALARTPVGEWATGILRGVEIVHTADPGAHGYQPYRNRLVLDVGLSEAEHMAALVHHAIHVESARAREVRGSARDLMTVDRDTYIERMLAEETRAHAMEIVAALQLRHAGLEVPEPPGTRAYTETFYTARSEARGNAGLADRPIPAELAPVLDRIANDAALHALRETVEALAPQGIAHAEFYGRKWDEAHAQAMPPRPDPGDGSRPAPKRSAQLRAPDPEWSAAQSLSHEARALLDDANRGRCGELSLRALLRMFGERSGIRLPERLIGYEGMTRGELIAAAGGWLRPFVDHAAIAAELRHLKAGAAALVVDMYRGKTDRYGVGGHAYLLVHEGDGRIVVRDLATDATHEDLTRLARDVRGTEAILFDHEGRRIDPVDEDTRQRLMREAAEELASAQRRTVGQAPGENPADRTTQDPRRRAELSRTTSEESSPAGVDSAAQRRPLDQVRRFLAEHAAARIDDEVVPRTDAERAYARELVEALRLDEALAGHPDPLAALQELAEIARSRGFFAETADGVPRPMRYPDDMGPLALDEAYGSEEYWRLEADPANTPIPAESAVRPNGFGAHRETGVPRRVDPEELRAELSRRFGLGDGDLTGPDRDRILQQLRYRNALRAGAIEALAEHIARWEAATDPEHRAQIETTRDGWARLLNVDPAELTAPERTARRVAELRAYVLREADDLADLGVLTAPREPLPEGARELVLQVGTDRVRLRVETGEDGTPRVVPDRRAHPEEAPDPDAEETTADKSWLRKAWEWAVRPRAEETPAAPSGSGSAIQQPDSAGSGAPAHPAHQGSGYDVGDFLGQLHGASELVKKLPIGLTVEVLTFWKERERIGDFFRGRHPENQLPPARHPDGSEYEYWREQADPKLLRQVGLTRAQAEAWGGAPQGDRAPEPHDREQPAAPEYLARPADGDDYQPGSAEREALRHWLEEVDRLHDERTRVVGEIVAIARGYGLELPDLSHASVQRAIDHLEYQIARRGAALEGWVDASRWYSAEDALVPYSREIDSVSSDPMNRFLQEVVRADDADARFLTWGGIKNKTSTPPPHWSQLFDDDGKLRDGGIRLYFEEALRREQIREQRATWEDLFPDDISRDETRISETVNQLREGTEARTQALGKLRALAGDYRDIDDRYRETGAALVDLAATEWLEHGEGGRKLAPGVWRVDGDPGRLVVVDAEPKHDEVLARALAHDADLAAAVNNGELVPDFRVGWVEPDGSVRIGTLAAPEARCFDGVVGDQQVQVTLLRVGDGPWQPVQAPADPVHPVDEPAGPLPEPRPRAELEQRIRDLAERLELNPDDLLGRAGSNLVQEEKLRNAVRAAQIEALVDYVRSAGAIEEFNDIGLARGELARRLSVPAWELTPEHLARVLSDPALGATNRNRAVRALTEYAEQVRDVDAAAVDAARDRLARKLNLKPAELHPRKFDDDLKKRELDTDGIDPKKLSKALANVAHRSTEVDGAVVPQSERLREYLREFAAELMRLDPTGPVWAGDLAADPRLVGGGSPMRSETAYTELRAECAALTGQRDPSPEAVARRLTDPATSRAQRERFLDALVDCRYEMPAGKVGRVLVERSRVARALGLEPRALHGHRYDDEHRRVADPRGIDTRALKRALAKLLRRGEATPEITTALGEFVRAVVEGEPGPRPRTDGGMETRAEHPIRDDSAIAHLRAVAGDLAEFGNRLDGTKVDGPAENGVNRDWARIIGVDAAGAELVEYMRRYDEFRTGAEHGDLSPEQRAAREAEMSAELQRRFEKYVEVYDAFRDGVIEDHERLSREEMAELHAELRAEVRERAEDLRALGDLLSEHRRAVIEDQRARLLEAGRTYTDAEQRLRTAMEDVERLETAARQRNERAENGMLSWAAVTDATRLEQVLDRLTGQTMPDGPAARDRHRAYRELAAAAEDYRRATADLDAAAAALDEAGKHLAGSLEHDALLEAGATVLIGDDIGIIEGASRCVAVAVWGEAGDPRAALEQAAGIDPLVDEIAGPDRDNVTVLRLSVDENGHVTVQREDPPEPPPTPDPAPEPDEPGSGGGERQPSAAENGDGASEHDPDGNRAGESPHAVENATGAGEHSPRARDGEPPPRQPSAADAATHARLEELNQRRQEAIRERRVLLARRNALAELLEVAPDDDWAALRRDRLGVTLQEVRERRGVQDLDELEHVVELIQVCERLVGADDYLAWVRREIDAAQLDESPQAEHDRLVERWHELIREREFLRAKRDERAELRDVAGLSGEALERKILELFEKTQPRTIRIPGTLDVPERIVHQQMAPAEVALRRRAIRKLVEAVEAFDRVDKAVGDIEARLAELAQDGVGDGRPRSPEVARELRQLETARAELFRNSFNKARRSMMLDLLDRLRAHDVPIRQVELGPDPAALDAALTRCRAALDPNDPLLQQKRRWLAALGDAAHDVIRVDNAMERLDDEAGRVTGQWADLLREEGARMVTDLVAVVDGAPPKIIVLGPRADFDHPRAHFDHALSEAARTERRVAHVMSQRPEIEYRQLIGGLSELRAEPLRTVPRVEVLDAGWRHGEPGIQLIRWRDGEGNWCYVDTTRPSWRTSGAADYPDAYDPGNPDWWGGLVHYINTLALPFVDIPPGMVPKDLLPFNALGVEGKFFQGDIPEDAIFSLDIGSEINAVQRNLRNLMMALQHPKVEAWIQRHPEIGDFLDQRPWLKKLPPFATIWSAVEWHRGAQYEVQPMFPRRDTAEHSADPDRVDLPEPMRRAIDRAVAGLAGLRDEQRVRCAELVVDVVRRDLVDGLSRVDLSRADLGDQVENVDRYLDATARALADAFVTDDPADVRARIADLQQRLVDAQAGGRVSDADLAALAAELLPHVRNDFAGGDEVVEQWRLLSWTDRQYERFRADLGLADKIVAGLDRHRRNEQVLAAREVVRRIKAELIDGVPVELTRSDAGARLEKYIDTYIHRHSDTDLRKVADVFDTDDRTACNAAVFAVRERLVEMLAHGRVTDEAMNRLAAELVDDDSMPRIRDDYLTGPDEPPPPAFTRAQVQQIIDHLLFDKHLVRDHADSSGRFRWRRMDQVADVAEAFCRLLEVEPVPDKVIARLRKPLQQDLVLLYDALAESEYERDPANRRSGKTWYDANAHAVAEGYHWDAVRPPLTGWRRDLEYNSYLADLLALPRAEESAARAAAALDALARELAVDPREAVALHSSPQRDDWLNSLRARHPDATDRVDSLVRGIVECEEADAHLAAVRRDLSRSALYNEQRELSAFLPRHRHELETPAAQQDWHDAAAGPEGDAAPRFVPQSDGLPADDGRSDRLSGEGRAVDEARQRLADQRERLRQAGEALDEIGLYFTREPRAGLTDEDHIIPWVDDLVSWLQQAQGPGEPDVWRERGRALEAAAREYLRAQAAVEQAEAVLAQAESRLDHLPPVADHTGNDAPADEANAALDPNDVVSPRYETNAVPVPNVAAPSVDEKSAASGGEGHPGESRTGSRGREGSGPARGDKGRGDGRGADDGRDVGRGADSGRGRGDDGASAGGARRGESGPAESPDVYVMSRIPHPPHFFDVEFPDEYLHPPTLRAPDPELVLHAETPEHPEPEPTNPPDHPQPPRPSQPPRRPEPSTPPRQPLPTNPPTRPEVPTPPVSPTPPQPPSPPKPPTPQPQPPMPPEPPVVSDPPESTEPRVHSWPQLPGHPVAPGLPADGGSMPDGRADGLAQNRSQVPMLPPVIPSQAPGGGQRRSTGVGSSEYGGGRIVVQAADGQGPVGLFDPNTGAMQWVSVMPGPISGIYGQLGETSVVLFRREGRLRLWAEGCAVDLDEPGVEVHWGRSDPVRTWFQVGRGGVAVVDARYPFPGADRDFGRLISAIVADPRRREEVFRQ